jgi:two-component system, OmpR family, phosphate regulon sensor histidine kinase PhoR
MNDKIPTLWTLLSERTIAVLLSALTVLAWAFNILSVIPALIFLVAINLLLLQLSARRRLEDRNRRRKTLDTKRKNLRKGIRSLRASALNSLPAPILLVDETKIISFANDSAKALLGDNITGDDILLYLRQASFTDALTNTLLETKPEDGAIRYTTSYDRSFDITISPVIGVNADGKKRVQAMVYFYEVTSLLQTEQMRVDFVSNASHELRTPLTVITGFIETLLGPAAEDSDARKRFLAIMQRESDRMRRLIDDLLSLSRIEMLRHVTPETQLNINQLILRTLESCSGKAGKRGISFQTVFDKNYSKVIGDDDQLTQVFMNLIGNAAKYADADTIVTLQTNIDPSYPQHLCVSVQDQGPGIPSEHLARLTERFYRVDAARSRKMGGTGLGLAIVKHILLRHDSPLEITSTLGSGTCFKFRLPIASQD